MANTATIDISKYPLLANNANISTLKKEVTDSASDVSTKTKSFEQAIKVIQAGCFHVWENHKKYDKNVASAFKSGGHIGYGANVLDSRTCTECGLTEYRPRGATTEICHVCWSPMKWHSDIPGQGERTKVYECTNPDCSHASWHT